MSLISFSYSIKISRIYCMSTIIPSKKVQNTIFKFQMETVELSFLAEGLKKTFFWWPLHCRRCRHFNLTFWHDINIYFSVFPSKIQVSKFQTFKLQQKKKNDNLTIFSRIVKKFVKLSFHSWNIKIKEDISRIFDIFS